jgi:cell division septation protein DedD
MAPVPGTGYFVQVAAVTKQEDADALVDALKKNNMPPLWRAMPLTSYFASR